MKLDSQTRSEIRRMHFVEHQSVNAIVQRTKCHHTTVKRALEKLNKKESSSHLQYPLKLNGQKEYIEELIERYPTIFSPRLHELLLERGIRCSLSTTRSALRYLRGKKRKVYGIRKLLPGQEAQVDWGEKRVKIGNSIQKIYIFVMVLSYSRHTFAFVTRDMKSETFMCCHSMAFKYFSGVPRKILYDNLKSVVTERFGNAIRFSKDFYDYASHYLFEPVACHPRTPQEKGRVERQVGVIKNNFFDAREFISIENVNNQLSAWLSKRLSQKHPDDKSKDINFFFNKEELLSYPRQGLWPRRFVSVRVGKQPYAMFETNRYSVPIKNAHSRLTLAAGMEDIEIYDGSELLALHPRSFLKDQIIEDHEHVLDFIKRRNKGTGWTYRRSYLLRLLPQLERMFTSLAKRDEPIASVVERFENLINKYDLSAVEKVIAQADDISSLKIEYIELILSQSKWDKSRNQQDQLLLGLPKHLQKIKTTHHNLQQYNINEDKINDH